MFRNRTSWHPIYPLRKKNCELWKLWNFAVVNRIDPDRVPKKNCELWKLWNFTLSVRDEVLIVYR